MLGVVGAGTMGNGIAQVFATYGHDVVLSDLDEEILQKAHGAIEKSLSRFVKKDWTATAPSNVCVRGSMG